LGVSFAIGSGWRFWDWIGGGLQFELFSIMGCISILISGLWTFWLVENSKEQLSRGASLAILRCLRAWKFSVEFGRLNQVIQYHGDAWG
jgi:hypothetical protein